MTLERAARRGFNPKFELMTAFMHEVPVEVVEELMAAAFGPEIALERAAQTRHG